MAKITVQTIEQVSAGGVPFRLSDNAIEVALIRTAAEGRWQLPKGIIDPGETPEQAAIREVREEAGINCELLEPVEVIEYWFYGNFDGTRKRYHKKVHFYLMRFLDGNIADHDHEVVEVRWVDLNTAEKMLAFKSEKELVAKARMMI
jgi:8-oxo-dGTP diphosphatase